MCRRGCGPSDAIGEQAHARSDRVADTSEDLETLGLGAARSGGVRQLPAEPEAAARWDGAARVAHRDDDVPALAHIVDGLALLFGDVDAKLAHDPRRERMDARSARARALDLEAVTGERAQKTLSHLGAGRVVRAEEQDALHASSMTRGAGCHPAPRGWSGEDCGAERVDERAWRSAGVEDLWTGVEDENEDDEDQQDDADDHAGTEAAVRRGWIHVDLAHWEPPLDKPGSCAALIWLACTFAHAAVGRRRGSQAP